jgi:hypothetical protein
MPYIILTDEQARVIEEASGPVDLRNSQGQPIASATPLSAEDREMIRMAKEARAKGGRRIPSAEVRAHLARLEEIMQERPLDRAEVQELIRRMQAGEKV